MRVRVLLTLLVISLASVVVIANETPRRDDRSEHASSALDNGATEWGLVAGFGMAIFQKRNMALLFEYRLHHISNASLAALNPGINSSCFQFGVSLFDVGGIRREK